MTGDFRGKFVKAGRSQASIAPLIYPIDTLHVRFVRRIACCHCFIFTVDNMSAAVLERVPLAPPLLAALRARLGDRVSTSAAVCAQHGKDESYHAPHAPDAVAFVRDSEEVAAIVRLCAEHKTP